jgi:hypothetical protein
MADQGSELPLPEGGATAIITIWQGLLPELQEHLPGPEPVLIVGKLPSVHILRLFVPFLLTGADYPIKRNEGASAQRRSPQLPGGLFRPQPS